MKHFLRSDKSSPPDASLDALFAAARAARPDTSRAEYGFETRLLARLAAERAGEPGWLEFSAWCWRLLPAFAVVTLAFSLWTAQSGGASPVDNSLFNTTAPALPGGDDLAQSMALELLAPI